MPVKHIVMFTLQDDVPEEKVDAMKQGLLRLPKTVDGFLSFELGTDLKLAAGQNHPAGKNRSIAWSASFASVADYERYNESKEHMAVVNDLIKPIVVPGSRAAIQYEAHCMVRALVRLEHMGRPLPGGFRCDSRASELPQ